jgi:type I restriction enzyme, S subunit
MNSDAPLIRLREVASFIGGGTPSRNSPEYFGGGIPWVKTTDLNNGAILTTEETLTSLGLRESSCKMVPAGAVLIGMYGGFNQIGRTGLLTQESAINQALTAIIPKSGVLDPQFLLEWLNFRVAYWKRFAASSRKDPNITKQDVADFPIPLLPMSQQTACASLISDWNAAILRTRQLIAALEIRTGVVSRKLLFGKNRLTGFACSGMRTLHGVTVPADWDTPAIGDIARECSAVNVSGERLPVLSCTKHNGLVDSLKYFGKQVFSQDTSKYKVVRRGQFAYATNHIEEGSIGYLDADAAGLVSPIYTVFEANHSRVDDCFLYGLLKTDIMRHIFEAKTSASVDRRGSLRWREFAQIQIPVPSLLEQRAICKVLSNAKREVVLLHAKLNRLIRQKRGLMHKLLTGRLPTGTNGHAEVT